MFILRKIGNLFEKRKPIGKSSYKIYSNVAYNITQKSYYSNVFYTKNSLSSSTSSNKRSNRSLYSSKNKKIEINILFNNLPKHTIKNKKQKSELLFMIFFQISFDVIRTEKKNMFDKTEKSLVTYNIFVHKKISFPTSPKSPFVRF